MRFNLHACLRLAGAAFLLAGSLVQPALAQAQAQALSGRPVKLISPYAPGGPGDAAARILAEEISPMLGVPVVVENKAGATGKIAVEAVKNAEPDGHTLFVGGSPQMVLMPLLEKSAKPFEELRMVSMFTNYDIIFMAGERSGVKSMKELVERMRAKNNDVSFASIGQAHLTPPGLAYLVMAKTTGGTAQEINYKGQAPGVLDLLAGRVTFGAYTLTGALQHIQAGKLVALAVASPQRLAALPDVPTMAELGYAEFASANNWRPWIAVAAPAKTPEPIVNQLNRAVVQASQSPAFRARLMQAGLNVQAVGTAAQDEAAWRAEFDRLSSTLKRFDIQPTDEKK